jgi:hypothetical protein
MLQPEDLPLPPGFERGDAHYYENPELGWSVPYSAPELIVTVYVYRGGSLTGSHLTPLSEEFRLSVEELIHESTAHGYEVVELGKSRARIDPKRLDATALHGRFLLRGSERTDTRSRFTETVLVCPASGFMKVRCTYTPHQDKKSGAAVNSLLTALRSVAGLQ